MRSSQSRVREYEGDEGDGFKHTVAEARAAPIGKFDTLSAGPKPASHQEGDARGFWLGSTVRARYSSPARVSAELTLLMDVPFLSV